MLDDKNSTTNLQSPSTYKQQNLIIQDNQNQPVQNQILSNQQPVIYQIISNQQPVKYQILPNQSVQYQMLPNLNSQIQYTPQNALILPVNENIYNPPISDPILKKLEKCSSIKIHNDYNYYYGREQYKVTGITKKGMEINLFKIIESSGSCKKCINSKYSKPMNLKFYSFDDNQLLNPLIEIKEGSCYVCGCICQDACIGINDVEVKTSNNNLTRIIKREKTLLSVKRSIHDKNGILLYSIEYDKCNFRITLILLLIILSIIILIIFAILAMLSGGNLVGGNNICCNCRKKIRYIYDKYSNIVGSIATINKCCSCCCCYSPIYSINFPNSIDIHSKLSLIGTVIEMDYTNL